ncbi:MAG: 3'(2'),5'-bisphosphate nucleotidase CysQ family protein [Alphaproteobacteria bacterium]
MENFLSVILNLSLVASRAIMDEYQKDNITITRKPDNSPVTSADIASHDIFKKTLYQYYPTIPLVSEEDFHPDSYPPQGDYFLLDPLDGTGEFIKKTGEFSISLAFIKGGVPCFGVICHPPTRHGYIGGDEGVYIYHEKNLQKITPPTTSTDTNIVVSPHDKTPMRFENILGKTINGICHRGSALKFFALLEGKANHYPRTTPSYEWDIAAGHALIKKLGGEFMAIDKAGKKQKMTYGKPDAKNHHFICYI